MSFFDRIKLNSSAGSALVAMVMPLVLSVALLTILFSLPQPTIPTNLPFKAETMLSAALLLILTFTIRPWKREVFARDRDPEPVRTISLAIVLFAVWSLVSYIWGGVFDGTAHHTFLWLVFLAYFLVFMSLLRTDPSNRFIVSVMAIVSIYVGILCIFDYFTLVDFKVNEGFIRIRYGKYAEMLATLSPMLWALTIYVKKRSIKLVLAAGALLSWITVMLSLSKGAFLGGLLGFIILFAGSILLSQKVLRRKIVIVAAIWFVFSVGFQTYFSVSSDVPATTDYISGAADPTRGTTAFRIFSWRLARQMFVDHWLIGVGADNFAIGLTESRIRYRISNPDDPKDDPGEDYIFERAHNEPLQIAAELGIVGLILAVIPFLLFAGYLVKHLFRKGRTLSPIFWASVAGMTAFAFSSMVSSFSFRSAQNGVVFFMIFAVGVNELSKRGKRSRSAGFSYSTKIYIGCWAAALLLGGYCASKIVAEYNVDQAESTGDSEKAHYHYKIARAFAPEYAGLHLSAAARNMADNEPEKAAVNTRLAISNGIAMALNYSALARQQIAAGLIADADATYQEALSVYPRSIYLRTEYIVFLEKQGRIEDAATQHQKARDVDLRNANGWYQLIKTGSVNAFMLSQSDESIVPPAELLPQAAVRDYLDPTPKPAEDQ